jgi:hypothetical protein
MKAFNNSLAILVLIFCASCNFNVNHRGVDIPEEFEVDANIGPNFKDVKEYCDGKVEHEVKKEKMENPNYNPTEEEVSFLKQDCYYSFDFDIQDPEFKEWLESDGQFGTYEE